MHHVNKAYLIGCFISFISNLFSELDYSCSIEFDQYTIPRTPITCISLPCKMCNISIQLQSRSLSIHFLKISSCSVLVLAHLPFNQPNEWQRWAKNPAKGVEANIYITENRSSDFVLFFHA